MSTPTWNESLFEDVQDAVLNRILGNERFREVAVFEESKGVTQSEIEASLMGSGQAEGPNRKFGLALLVMMPRFEQPNQSMPGPVGTLSVDIGIGELPEINRGPGGTGITASVAVANLINLFSIFRWGTGSGKARTLRLPADAVQPVSEGDGMVNYQVRVSLEAGLDRVTRVAQPSISVSGGQVTITCATAGAEIYYSTDGSYPRPARSGENLTARLYSAPFSEPSTPWTIRAAAYGTLDQVDSHVVQLSDTEV